MTATATEVSPEIKKGRKYDQVLEGARAVFLQIGRAHV